jgi:hypothetical protein
MPERLAQNVTGTRYLLLTVYCVDGEIIGWRARRERRRRPCDRTCQLYGPEHITKNPIVCATRYRLR